MNDLVQRARAWWNVEAEWGTPPEPIGPLLTALADEIKRLRAEVGGMAKAVDAADIENERLSAETARLREQLAGADEAIRFYAAETDRLRALVFSLQAERGDGP